MYLLLGSGYRVTRATKPRQTIFERNKSKMENTIKGQLFLNSNFNPTSKSQADANSSLSSGLVEQKDNIRNSEKTFVKLAMSASDIIFYKTTKDIVLEDAKKDKEFLKTLPLPLFKDVEEELKNMVKNICTKDNILDDEMFLKLQGSFSTALRTAYLVVGIDTGYQFGQRRDSNKKEDKRLLEGEKLKVAQRSGDAIIWDIFADKSKTFKRKPSEDANLSSFTYDDTDEMPSRKVVVTKDFINDSYSKFIVGREIADNGAEFIKQGKRNSDKNITITIPEDRKNYIKLLKALTNNLVQNLPTDDENETNQLSIFLLEEEKLIKSGKYPTEKDTDGKIKNKPTVSQLLVELAQTIDKVVDNLGCVEEVADIIEGDLESQEQQEKQNLINARLNQEKAHTSRKKGKEEELKKSA